MANSIIYKDVLAGIEHWQGLSTDTKPASCKPLSTYIETDTGNKYEYRGATAGWHLVSESASGPIYTDGTYNYFGEAAPGSALTAAVWKVSRMTIANNRIEWADGNSNYDNVYTSLAVVSTLTFS